jgi:hypothetical protein
MNILRRSPRLAKLLELEADNGRLRQELEQAYRERNRAVWERDCAYKVLAWLMKKTLARDGQWAAIATTIKAK